MQSGEIEIMQKSLDSRYMQTQFANASVLILYSKPTLIMPILRFYKYLSLIHTRQIILSSHNTQYTKHIVPHILVFLHWGFRYVIQQHHFKTESLSFGNRRIWTPIYSRKRCHDARAVCVYMHRQTPRTLCTTSKRKG